MVRGVVVEFSAAFLSCGLRAGLEADASEACYGYCGPEKKKKRGGERKGKKRRNLSMAR